MAPKLLPLWPTFLRIRLRRLLGVRGPIALDSQNSVEILSGAAVEAFGDYSAGIPIFDFLWNLKEGNSATKVSLLGWQLGGIEKTCELHLDTMELKCLQHRRADRTWQKKEAEAFRSFISLWVRDEDGVPSGSILESQISVVATYALWALLRMRRYEQARTLINDAALMIAAVIQNPESVI